MIFDSFTRTGLHDFDGPVGIELNKACASYQLSKLNDLHVLYTCRERARDIPFATRVALTDFQSAARAAGMEGS